MWSRGDKLESYTVELPKMLNRLCWILAIADVVIVGLLRAHLSWAMWVASFTYLLLCMGLRFREHKPLHPILMASAVIIDLGLVAVLQFQRGAIQTALGFGRPLLEQIHIAFSASA